MIIYKIECNGQFYIGSSKYFNRRINHHKYCCSKEGNDKYNLPLYKYIRENGGFDNTNITIVKILDVTNIEEQKKEEQKSIEELKPSLNRYKAFQPIDNKIVYDSLRYAREKTVLCPCCNKLKNKYNFIIHQKTKKYKKYISNINNNDGE